MHTTGNYLFLFRKLLKVHPCYSGRNTLCISYGMSCFCWGVYDMANSHRKFSTAVYRQARRAVSFVVFGGNSTSRKYTLLILLCFGLAGILIDLDHLIIAQTQMARPLHLPYFILIWIICIGYYAYSHRRVHQSRVEPLNRP